jgi:hypothetical protein
MGARAPFRGFCRGPSIATCSFTCWTPSWGAESGFGSRGRLNRGYRSCSDNFFWLDADVCRCHRRHPHRPFTGVPGVEDLELYFLRCSRSSLTGVEIGTPSSFCRSPVPRCRGGWESETKFSQPISLTPDPAPTPHRPFGDGTMRAAAGVGSQKRNFLSRSH